MAIDPPYRLDPFQNIINICWTGEGLTEYSHAMFIWAVSEDPTNINWQLVAVSDRSTGEEAAWNDLLASLLAEGYHEFAWVNYDQSIHPNGFLFPTLSACLAAATDIASDHNSSAIASFTNQYSYCIFWWQAAMLDPPFPYKGIVMASFDVNDVSI